MLGLKAKLIGGAIAAAAIIAAYAIWHHHVFQQGADANQAKIDADNQQVINETDQHRARVRRCNATVGMRWSQADRDCIRVDEGVP